MGTIPGLYQHQLSCLLYLMLCVSIEKYDLKSLALLVNLLISSRDLGSVRILVFPNLEVFCMF